MTDVFTCTALILLVYMSCMFVVGLKAGDNSLIDIAYGPAFIAACWGAWLLGPESTRHPRAVLLLLLIGIWGVRLGLHIGLRHRGKGEDFRYRRFREDWGSAIIWRSFLQIYMLQGLHAKRHYLVTLNRPTDYDEQQVIARMTYQHPVYTERSMATQTSLPSLNGVNNTCFCGSYFGYGFHEDAVRSGYQAVARLGRGDQ
jgi:steroid 5-alpha reductase family enzyme